MGSRSRNTCTSYFSRLVGLVYEPRSSSSLPGFNRGPHDSLCGHGLDQGDVPRSLLKTDEYFRNEGPFVITARKPASLLQEKSVGYIETVSFQEGRDVSIETVTETMLESLFRRLGGSAA